MVKNQYMRKLNRWEAKRHYVRVLKKSAVMFPPIGTTFKVLVGKREFEVRIDKQRRIWAGWLWRLLPHFREGDIVMFSKNEDGSFIVNIKK
jgi:hypothetical protein